MLLWGDTINANIQKYFERYFSPTLKQLPNSYWSFNKTNKVLKIGNSVCDFRSADKPENWEGFGYDIILLNEAGIILKDDYLYENTVLPMMLDNPKSRLIAGGVPKGKTWKGQKHKFYELWQSCLDGEKGFTGLKFTTYDSYSIQAYQIEELKNKMPPVVFQQEMMAEFVDIKNGEVFKRAILTNEIPDGLRYYIGSDLAYSKTSSSDYSVVVVLGVDSLNKIYIIHVERWQSEIGATIERLKAIQNKYNVRISVEANGVQKAVADMVQNAGVWIQRLNPVNDKLTRSLPFAVEWNSGNVYVKNDSWTLDFCNEIENFSGNGKDHDDQVDAVVNAFQQTIRRSSITL
jgi:predicted phage terminase large subunit-like protein